MSFPPHIWQPSLCVCPVGRPRPRHLQDPTGPSASDGLVRLRQGVQTRGSRDIGSDGSWAGTALEQVWNNDSVYLPLWCSSLHQIQVLHRDGATEPSVFKESRVPQDHWRTKTPCDSDISRLGHKQKLSAAHWWIKTAVRTHPGFNKPEQNLIASCPVSTHGLKWNTSWMQIKLEIEFLDTLVNRRLSSSAGVALSFVCFLMF